MRASNLLALKRSRPVGPAARGGFALIELAMVITILSLLAVISVPAVQHARERARRIQCQANLKQILQVFHAIHSSSGEFPSGGFHKDVLAYLGSPPDAGQSPLFVCPSDPESIGQITDYRQSYYMNYGIDSREKHQGFGHLATIQKFGPEKFRDGLSRTAAVAERLAWPPLGNRVVYWEDYPEWWIRRLRDTAVYHEDLDAFADECEHRALKPLKTWFVSGNMYHHTLPPNRNSCINESLDQRHYARTSTSLHPGGVNLALADGSVKFFADDVDRAVWRSLGTRSGDELVPSF